MTAVPTDEGIKTYRYVRLAMVVLVVGISAAMLREHAASHAWLGSISAYYYTPARGIFTAALVGIGVCLICLRGPSPGEDMLLNAAGMLAPIVAIVPTKPGAGDCARIFDAFVRTYEIHFDKPKTAEQKCIHVFAERGEAVSNNFPSLVVLGCIGFALPVGLVVWRRIKHYQDVLHRGDVIGFAVAIGMAVVIALLYAKRYGWFMDNMHFIAAGGMFVLVAACSVIDGIKVVRNLGRRARGYGFIAVGLLLVIGGGLLLMIGWRNDWRQTVLWAELWAISWFAVFWIGQTADLWDTTTRDKSPAAQAAAAVAPPRPAESPGVVIPRLKAYFDLY